jgi:hypothetical protein
MGNNTLYSYDIEDLFDVLIYNSTLIDCAGNIYKWEAPHRYGENI